MSDLAVVDRLDSEWAGRELAVRAATVARRVATVVEESCSPESGAADAVAFVGKWADSASPLPTGTDGDGIGADHNVTDHPLDLLTARYGLSGVEVGIILLAGLPEEHEGLAATFRAFHPQGEPRPTVGLAALTLGGGPDGRSVMRRLLTGSVAARGKLFRTSGTGALFEKSIVLAEGLWDVLHGCDGWPTKLDRMPVSTAPSVALEHWLAGPEQRRATRALERHESVTVLISTADEKAALQRCAALASHSAVSLIAGRCARDDAEGVAGLVAIAAAQGAIPVVVVDRPPDAPSTIDLSLEDMPPPIMVCAPPGSVRIVANRAVLTVPSGPVGVVDHRAAWRATLPHLAEHSATLAARHPIDPALYAEVGTDALLYERLGREQVGLEEVAAMIRARAAVALPPGVTMVAPDVPWSRLVLPPELIAQLGDAVARLELESLVLDDWGLRGSARATGGVRLLFSGPPGTGKSLAAEVVATAAATDLLVVDFSQIVSKWLGETEKNIAAVFDAAERMQAVLFVDECDGLFTKRTDVSDSHDRYANLETSYLLQRLDHFDGLTVLATNLRHNIDAAFVRRMDFVVDFTLPELDCRRELWTLHLPAGMLAADVDTDVMARMYPVPGGWIRNAAIAASFLAARGDGRIHQNHLVAAMRREYLKAALPFPGEPPRRRDDQML